MSNSHSIGSVKRPNPATQFNKPENEAPEPAVTPDPKESEPQPTPESPAIKQIIKENADETLKSAEESTVVFERDFDDYVHTPISDRIKVEAEMDVAVNHPSHYTWLPSGVEVIDITEHFNSNVGQALQYIMRHPVKDHPEQDLRKAIWFLERELKRGLEHGFMNVEQ